MRREYLTYAHYDQAENDDSWRWENFTPREMACRATGKVKVGCVFMDRLQLIRTAYGKPIEIVSGYRTPDHNAAVTSNRSMTGAHTYGRAVDIAIGGAVSDVPYLLALAWTYGMTRCGLQLSLHRFKMHLDNMTAAEGFVTRDDAKGLYCWTY